MKPRIVLRERRVNRAEGALVDGRHPGSIKSWPLTRRRWRRAWRFVAAEVGRKAAAVRDGSRQRVSEATLHARFAVENTVTGSVCRRGCRSQLRQDREAPCSGGSGAKIPLPPRRRLRQSRSWRVAVKRSSTWFSPYRRAARLRGKRVRESMDPQGARVVGRLQKSVEASFPSPVRCAERRAGSAGDSLKRPPIL